MDFESVFTGVGMCIGLLLAYLALTPESQARFWPIMRRLFQVMLLIYAAYWIGRFATTSGSPSRLEIFNFAVWCFNFLMTSKSLIEESIDAALSRRKSIPRSE